MTKIAFIIYRKWAFKILINIKKRFKKSKIILITNSKPEFNLKNLKLKKFQINPNNNLLIHKILKENQIDVVFFYGWSWFIENKVIQNFLCICLHPSKLPQFRGGSPIQNQIFRGVKNSAITVFRMNKKVDQGPIFMQKKSSLKGNLKKIFSNMSNIGTKITIKLLNDFKKNKLKFYKQKGKISFYKRLTYKENQKNLTQLKKITYSQLYDQIRSLQFPYPGLKVKFKKKIIKIINAKKVKKKTKVKLNKNNYIELKDSYAKLLKYKVL